ncbi:hypothetical protein KJ910_04975 [Patescibacteria group bacterium]|nr:hypothetical protein [Patescibacteria group bacterium]
MQSSKKFFIFGTAVVILIITISVFFALALREQEVSEAPLACDFNFDGFVDNRELRRCGEDGVEPDQEPPTTSELEVIGQTPDGRTYADFEIYSESTGSAGGKLAVRAYLPTKTRHAAGAPIVITGAGGSDAGGMENRLPVQGDDFVMITFMFPGGDDRLTGRSSEGVYDFRGEQSIMALRDVILFAAGQKSATNGRGLDDMLDVPVDHENIGLIGFSNGGNIVVAVAAEYGTQIKDYVKYIIQWETPVSSQAATRDFGRTLIRSNQVEYMNHRYCGYGDEIACSDYRDLVYNAAEPDWPVFHDGNGDGEFTMVFDPSLNQEVPDLDLSGSLETDEDWPLGTYEDQAGLAYYSRAVTNALDQYGVFGVWPEGIATPVQADGFWSLREAVVLYDEAIDKIPGLEAMVLCGERDHVQSSPDKFHVHQALEGWMDAGADWVKLNPSLEYLYQVDPRFEELNLPDTAANTQPTDWTDFASYAMPEKMNTASYQLAALWQMMDRAED